MMDIASVTIGFLIMLGAMTLGLHIATVMFGVGFIGAALYLGWPGVNAMIVVYLGSMDESVLLQLPLFILLGEILVRCGATDRMYRSLTDAAALVVGTRELQRSRVVVMVIVVAIVGLIILLPLARALADR